MKLTTAYADADKLLSRVQDALLSKHFHLLRDLSDQTIHTASVIQDELSVDLAVCLYALYKVVDKQPSYATVFNTYISDIRSSLKKPSLAISYIKKTVTKLSHIDKQIDEYVQEVIHKAKIKKGTHIYYHGISLGRTAYILGLSPWELYNYIGKTTISDDLSDDVSTCKKRLVYTRNLFDTTYSEKKLVFDAGPIITLSLSQLLVHLPAIIELTKSTCFIPQVVYDELISQPLHTRKHKLEAYSMLPYFHSHVIHIVRQKYVQELAQTLLTLCNTIYTVDSRSIPLVHTGEMHALALLVVLGARTFVVDERTTRTLLEQPFRLQKHLEQKLHQPVLVNTAKLEQLQKYTAHIRCIRSCDLLVVGFEKNLFESYFESIRANSSQKRDFLQAVLWSIKLAGCSISEAEIAFFLKVVGKSDKSLKTVSTTQV
jgi:hypothetical protein